MERVKKFIKDLLAAAGMVLAILAVCFMIMIMITWTIGLVYVLNESGCIMEAGKLVCG